MFRDLSRASCVFAGVVLLTGCGNRRLLGKIQVHRNEKAMLAISAPKNDAAWLLVFDTDPAGFYSKLKDTDTVVAYLENADSSPLKVSGIPGLDDLSDIAPTKRIKIYDGLLSNLVRPAPNTPERFVLASTRTRNVNIRLFLEFHLSGADHYAVCVELYHDLEGP